MTAVGIPGDPNLERIQAAFAVADQVVLVGGCATGLLVTSVRSEIIRPTRDVDVVIEMVRRAGFQRFESELRDRGFVHDQSPEAPICRWRCDGVILDLMPTSPELLGFGNRWYQRAVELAENVTLPSGQSIRLVSAPVFLLTKFEAFKGRRGDNLMFSHDLEDIVTLLDGRDALEEEIAAAPADIRYAVRDHCLELLSDQRVTEVLQGFLPGDAASQGRLPDVIARLQRLAGHGD